jgi:nitrogen regulatory protein PII
LKNKGVFYTLGTQEDKKCLLLFLINSFTGTINANTTKGGELMKKIEAIIRPGKLEELKAELDKVNIRGLTVYDVKGHGLQKGEKQYYRGQEHTSNLIPKIKIEIVCSDQSIEDIISTILKVCKTGKIGDGKIFVYPIERAIRISTREEGEAAI